MALTDPKDTLAYHASRVLVSQRDMSHISCESVAKALLSYQSHHGPTATPETEALYFYGLNHGVALISNQFHPLEPLPEWALNFVVSYHEEMVPRAVRAFYYLLLICTREARHNQSLKHDYPVMVEKFGKEVADFFVSIKGGEASIHQQFVHSPPKATIGAYCDCMAWQFYKSKWNSGYGGKAWGNIADCLCRFVKGEFSAEMMLDTIWTLSHNNGPIFNKSLFYKMYHLDAIIRILDVQRSGQIPEAILHDGYIAGYRTPELYNHMLALKERFPDKIGDYVDWDKVEILGSVKKYPEEKQAQHEKYGPSEAAQAALEAKKKAQEEHAKKFFTVMPGVEVKKIELVREAA